MFKKLSVGFVLLVISALVLTRIFLPAYVDNEKNVVIPHKSYAISDDAQALHDSLRIMDWHSDFLLWDRDLLETYQRGHGDLPRMQEGNLAIQMFTAVTKSPSGQNYSENSAEASDRITALVIAQTWPLKTFNSLKQRALYQAQRLGEFAKASEGNVLLITNRSSLQNALQKREQQNNLLIAMLGIEGLHALDGEIESVSELYDAGYRMMGLQHFFDNKLGGSLHGQSGEGLTEFGKMVVKQLNDKQIIIDLSHSSEAVVKDVLKLSTRPVVLSHTGMKGACNTERNISDTLMKQVAEQGGLVAIGFWEAAICDITPAGLAKMLRYAVDELGVDHVALGSDYDGSVTTSFDVSELAAVTQAMIDHGFSENEIRSVMGENSIRFLLENLPE